MHSHLYHVHNILSGNITKLTLAHTLKSFSLSLIAIFFPIYLYLKGFSLVQIFLAEAIAYSAGIFVKVWVLNFTAKNGIKISFILGYIFLILFYLILFFSDFIMQYGIYFFLIIAYLFSFLGNVFYWMAYHLDFTLNFDVKNEGRQLGFLYSLPIFLMIFAPFFGSILIFYFGFEFVYLIVFAFLLVSLLPIFMSSNKILKDNLKLKDAFLGYDYRLNIIYVIEGFISIVLSYIWVLLLFFLGISLTLIGGFYVFSNSLHAFASYFAGRMTQNKNKKYLFNTGSSLLGISIILRALFDPIYLIASFQSLGGFSSPFYIISLHSVFYKLSKKTPLKGIANREMYLNFGRISCFLLGIFLVINYEIKVALVITMILSGLLVISSRLISFNFNDF